MMDAIIFLLLIGEPTTWLMLAILPAYLLFLIASFVLESL